MELWEQIIDITNICTHFKKDSNNLNFGYYYMADGWIVFKDKDKKYDLNGFKAWLKEQYDAGTPITIYYELEEPQIHQLNPVEIPLFEGINNVELIEDLETNTSLTYYRKNVLNDAYYTKKETNALLKLTSDNITLGVNKRVSELSKSIQEFSTDLDYYNILIPVDNNNNPLETKDFLIGHYSYFKGEQIKVKPTILSKNITGLNVSADDTNITIKVDTKTAITNLTNELEFLFEYADNEKTYSLIKKVMVNLAEKGIDGKDGEKGEKGEKGDTGSQGIQGPKGDDGKSSYFYIKYSEHEDGNPMVDIPTSSTIYMGVASTTSSSAPTSPSAYKWSKIKGENGTNGTPGQKGTDGKTPYLHIKYSEDGETFTPADEESGYGLGEKPSAWLGQYTDYTEADSTKFNDYTWYKFTESIDGTLNNLQEQISDASNEMTGFKNDLKDTNNRFNDYAREDSVIERFSSVDQKISSSELKITAINELLENGVSKLKTETGYTFGTDGLNIGSTNSPVNNTIDERGMEIEDNSSKKSLLFAGYDAELQETIVRAENMNVNKYLSIPHARFEKYNNPKFGEGTGCFYAE